MLKIILSTAVSFKDIMLTMENCKYVATALNNIAALNSWEKEVVNYFLDDDRAMQC